MQTITADRMTQIIKSMGGTADLRQLVNALRVGSEGAADVIAAAEAAEGITVKIKARKSGTPIPESTGLYPETATFYEEVRFSA